MLVHCRSLPCNFVKFPQQFAGTHLYTWVERGSVRVKCLAQEHNSMSPVRARTRTTQSGVEHTNHEATVPPTVTSLFFLFYFNIIMANKKQWIEKQVAVILFQISVISSVLNFWDQQPCRCMETCTLQKRVNLLSVSPTFLSLCVAGSEHFVVF